MIRNGNDNNRSKKSRKKDFFHCLVGFSVNDAYEKCVDFASDGVNVAEEGRKERKKDEATLFIRTRI